MDNYKLEEVKKIIDENLLSPSVLENILKSTTRRIEIHDDHEAVEILSYLSNHEIVPNETKEEINKFLAQYNSYHVENVESINNSTIRKHKIIFLYFFVIILILLAIILYIKSRG